jgi:CxxC-x17-CxxC domain-containing protein
MAYFKKAGGSFGGSRGGKPGFKKGGFGGGSRFGGDRGGSRFGGGRDGGRTEMFDATCANCNKECQVPFRPSGEKPVFCSSCFRRDDDRGGERGNDRGGDFDRKPKPSRNFDFRERAETVKEGKDNRIDELKTQIDSVSAKLDKLIGIVSEMGAKTTEDKPVAKKKVVAKKK